MRQKIGPHFVYIVFDNEGVPRYVGQSRYRYRHPTSSIWVIVREHLTLNEAYEIEAQLISVIGCAPEGPLRNKARHSNKGWHHNETSKKAIGAGTRGKPKSADTKLKLSRAHKGKVLSEAHKQAISAGGKGKKRPPVSQAHRAALSRAMKGKTKAPVSAETCQKLRESSLRHAAERRKNKENG